MTGLKSIEGGQMTNESVIAQLRKMGFTDEFVQTPRRLIVALAGQDGTAKTHFAMTGPAPIFYFDMDDGGEGVVGKFQESGKKVYTYRVRTPHNRVQAEYQTMWFNTKEAILTACGAGQGCFVFDTASEMYELSRLSHFGKLEQVQPFHYAQVNYEWQDILAAIYDSKMSAVMIHRVKPKYVNNARTSEYEVSGFSDTGYKVQVKLEAFKEVAEDDAGNPVTQFGMTVEKCRPNAGLNGKTYKGVLPVKPGVKLQVDPVLNFDFLLNQVLGSGK
jgi:hypothetical protein